MLNNSNDNTFQWFLALIQSNNTPVAVYLQSGIRLVGKVVGYDREGIFIKNHLTQFVYFHHVSTIVPDIKQVVTGRNVTTKKQTEETPA